MFVQDQRALLDVERAADYTTEAAALHVNARTLTFLADEVVTNALALPDHSPKRRAGLALAAALRDGANAHTLAAREYEERAADHLAYGNSLVAS